MAEANQSARPPVRLLQEENTPELRSSDECSESFNSETSIELLWGFDSCRRVIPTLSEASSCEVSEQLKQDGGSSRGSGDRVWNVVPKATSGRTERKRNMRSRFMEGLILASFKLWF